MRTGGVFADYENNYTDIFRFVNIVFRFIKIPLVMGRVKAPVR